MTYIIISDHTLHSVTKGPPITIEWNHSAEETHDLETYESIRSTDRRLQKQMKIPPSLRTDILINHGYSRKEIREVSKEATVIRRARLRSIETLHKDKMDEKVEVMRRMLWKPFKSKKQRDEERLMKEFYASDEEFYEILSRSKSDSDLARSMKGDDDYVHHQENKNQVRR